MNTERPRWAPRVSRYKIAQLYFTDAKGIIDEELIDEVGYGLIARCESILTVTEAHRGRAVCPQCGHIINHKGGKREVLRCRVCQWQIPWPEYHKSYRKKGLLSGGIGPFIKDFLDCFPKAKTYREKMILIDTLIHRYHWELEGDPGRPGAVNLIGGKVRDVIAFLNDLTYSENSTAGLRKNLEVWRKNLGER